MMGYKGTSMFNQYKEFIIQKLDEGLSIKDVFKLIDHDSGFYEYCSFYSYVRNSLKYKSKQKVDCEHCNNIIWVFSPTAHKMKPVCLAKKRIMRTDFMDKPFICQCYEKEVDHG